MDTEFNISKVEENMAFLEDRLGELMDNFQSDINNLKQTHDRGQEILTDLMEANIANMQLLAKAVLSDYEKEDVSKHWRTRRSGYWGYLSDLGGRVADRVFPCYGAISQQATKSLYENYLNWSTIRIWLRVNR